jgi:hypothetical protein
MASDTKTPNASLSGLVATLIPALIIALVYFTIFLVLRKSHRRWYAPRTYLGTIREQERTVELPGGWFNWIPVFRKVPDIYALQHQSLDAYLFLRFLKMCVVVMFVGACITWPILFPVNITGGAGQTQLDMLSMSNVDKNAKGGKYRYFAHMGAAWLFFGFVLALVTRESIYYVNLRQAFLLSPAYANRISSRTVLFTAVPKLYLDEAKLRKVFGDSVVKVWITHDTEKVDELVEERDKVALTLEGAEVKLIKTANAERLKAIKKGAASADEQLVADEADVESGSIAARWIPTKMRPSHKLGKFGLYGQKVDSIEWARTRLETLVPETAAAQSAYLAGETDKVGAVFIEFQRQSDAQAAFQTLSHHQALHMSSRYIGIQPSEIVWKSLKMSWSQRVIRTYAVYAFISALIIFWAIPVAFVGLISNISYLETYSWLKWLEKIPSSLMGIISGLLPVVALSILMSLVPVIMRLCAKLAGEPSLARVELFTQNAYFVFQVVQVFLVVTIASSASAVLKSVIADPSSVTSLLALRIPTASNFYISYFILQGLSISAGVVSQVVGFVIFKLMYKYLAGTPRKMYMKWAALSAISWGSVLPPLTNIAVIGLVYACIAPLVLGFATIGMGLFYLAFRYNILFVTDAQIDTKGLIYPRALQQLLTGVYIGEICLIGLFAIATTPGPLILMVVFLIFTALFHLALNSALNPLLYSLPKSLEAEEESFRAAIEHNAGTPEPKEKNGEVTEVVAPVKEPNFLTKFLKPHVYSDYATLRKLVPHDIVDADNLYEEKVANDAYYPPSATSDIPLLWIPRDMAGISKQEVEHTSKFIPITDEGAILDENNKLIWDPEGARPPLWQPKVYY